MRIKSIYTEELDNFFIEELLREWSNYVSIRKIENHENIINGMYEFLGEKLSEMHMIQDTLNWKEDNSTEIKLPKTHKLIQGYLRENKI